MRHFAVSCRKHRAYRTLFVLSALVLTLAAVFPVICEARDLTKEEKKLISDAITKDFKDPESARFRWLPMPSIGPKDFESVTYCASVNGKNSYGAYTGYKPFAVFLVTKSGSIAVAALLMVGSSESEYKAVMKTCAQKGLDPREAK